MNKNEIFQFMTENPAFHLATMDKDQPRVRGMLLFRADENGIIFHTASSKDLYQQIMANNKAELCFYGNGTQIRVTGVLKEVKDDVLKQEIYAHPTRKFLQSWKSLGIDSLLAIFRLEEASAVVWTMADNFKEKVHIPLS